MILTDILKTSLLHSKFFKIKSELKDIFSWKDLENILNLRPFVEPNRFRIHNTTSDYSWVNDKWTLNDDSVPADVLETIVRENFCSLLECSRVNYKINSICSELDNLLDVVSDAHLYWTLDPKNQGVGEHKDSVNVLVLQIEGETEVSIEDLGTYMLHPGDAIYIPSGKLHNFVSKTARLSISFPMSKSQFKACRYWLKI